MHGHDERIVRWIAAPNPGPLTLDGTRSYAVGLNEAVLIDPGPALPGQLDRLRALIGDRSVAAICLTHAHADHSASAADAAAEFSAPIAASADTLARCGLMGEELSDGTVITLDDGARSLTALAAPGHSADHMVFMLAPSRALFTGDLVLGAGSSVILHPDGDVGACLTTFERLLSVEPGTLYPGHGDPVEDGHGKLVEYREHRLARHAEVVRAVRSGIGSVSALRAAVYGELASGLKTAADASIRAHLAFMQATEENPPRVDGFEETAAGGATS